MPKAFFRKAFEHWLGQNRHRFQHPPRITLQRRDYLELHFQGVTPQIKGFISRNGTSFHIWHAGHVIDMLNDIDIVERRRSDGRYYCELCMEPVDDYASRQELWEQHCFEPMLEWANAHFQPGQWLHIVVTGCGSSWASIRPRSDCNESSMSNRFSGAWPVLLNAMTTDQDP